MSIRQQRLPAPRNTNRTTGFGIAFLLASSACVAGNLTSHRIAAIIAVILLALAVAAFALRRAGLVLEDILDEDGDRRQEHDVQPPTAA
ncbi:MAG TPA: hypothetical protein VHZ97_06160 [Pseudonocardiaceae bacterium]|jgi:4-hydroxybenzoate polyprenyltransferase|nr:hypothetical protein [Pseudonocardiaceae bacterium]